MTPSGITLLAFIPFGQIVIGLFLLEACLLLFYILKAIRAYRRYESFRRTKGAGG